MFSWGLQTLSCLTWDLVPWPGGEPRPLPWEHRVLASGPPGKSPPYCFCLKSYLTYLIYSVGFPGGASGKEPACQCRRQAMWVRSLGWASVFGASILFARSEHPFLGLRYFWIHTFPSPESCDWRSIEFPAFPPSLAKELLQVSQWSYLLQTLIHSLLHPGHFLGGLIKQPASYDSSSTPAHTFTHTHTEHGAVLSAYHPLCLSFFISWGAKVRRRWEETLLVHMQLSKI